MGEITLKFGCIFIIKYFPRSHIQSNRIKNGYPLKVLKITNNPHFQFVPKTEKVCENNYEKHCSINFKKVAHNETLIHCYNPLVRECVEADSGEEECKEYQETSCTTRYVEKTPGKFLADTSCEQIPVQYCTTESCSMVPGPQECHDKVCLLFVTFGL